MKILGLDYGNKNIGIAVSDETRAFAFPKAIIPNNDKIFGELSKIIESDEIEKIVVGDPGENLITEEVKNFARVLEEKFSLPIIFEKEFMTSAHVSQFGGAKPIARQEKKEIGEKRDDSAAALILQRYLDRKI
jgi:putative holliday junction resolvase